MPGFNTMHSTRFRLWGGLLLSTCLFAGCQGQGTDTAAKPGPAAAPVVATVKPEKKTLRRVIEQPGQIEGFEETPLVARIPGFVAKVHCDIGKRLKGPK